MALGYSRQDDEIRKNSPRKSSYYVTIAPAPVLFLIIIVILVLVEKNPFGLIRYRVWICVNGHLFRCLVFFAFVFRFFELE